MLTRQFIQSVHGLFFLVSSSFALSNTEFTYNVIDGGIELTGCVDGCPSDLVIPEEIDGYSVLSIGEYAFSLEGIEDVEAIQNVIIPEGIKVIGRGAFHSNMLTSVDLPNSLEYLAGFNNNHIATIAIPNNVTHIGLEAFIYTNLKSVEIPNSVQEIDYEAFKNNQLTSLIFFGEAPTLEFNAFLNNSLTSITYCQDESDKWDGVIIEGITPQLDENCGDSNDHRDDHGHDEHEEEHHGDEEYCYPYGDEHEEHEDGHEEEYDHDGHCYSAIDLDQNGSFEALTDALMLLRYAFGLRGDNLINGAIAADANVTTAEEIELQIQMLLP